MSQTERLREALLEIEVLRAREQDALRDTRALLDILSVTTTAENPLLALRSVLAKSAEALNAAEVSVICQTDDAVRVETSTNRSLEGLDLPIDPGFLRKPRNIVDARKVPKLSGIAQHDSMAVGSLLSSPFETKFETERAIICTHPQNQRFNKGHLDLLKQVIRLTAQALRTLELSSQNALLAAVIDGSSSGFAIADATQDDLPLIFVNKAFEALTGYQSQEVIGQNCRFLSDEPPDSLERTRLRQAVTDRRSGRFLLKNRKKSGDMFWNDLSLFPVHDSEGRLTQMVATQTDASARVLADTERRLAQTRLQDALDHTNDAFLMVLADGTIAFSNEGTREMFDATPLSWQIGSTFRDNWAAYKDRLAANGDTLPEGLVDPDLELLCEARDGLRTGLPSGRQVLFRAQKTREQAFVISATDTTAIRDTERLLRQRAAAIENAIDGIGIVGGDGLLVYANQALAELLRYDSEDTMIGRAWSEHYKQPDNAELLRAEAGLSDRADLLELVTKERRRILHEVTVTPVAQVGDVVVVRDITSALQNRQRLAELNKQMEEARRREALSNLAAGLAHDFNNVLSAISGSATLISTDDTASEDIKAHSDRISKASATAARLVNRMLDLSTVDDDASIFDLRSVLGEVRALAEVNLSSDTSLVVNPGTSSLNVRAAIADITLVLLNLVINANDAMPDGSGVISVSLSRFSPSADRAPMVGKVLSDRAYASITVSDTGTGIAPDVLPRVLESFFTTKGSRGTGAGLAMVSAIVKRLGGALFIDSELGHGTSVEVILPMVVENVTAEDASVGGDLRGKAILILDDQPEVAEVVASFLETCGAEVSVLEEPALAIETVLEDPSDWAALITDYDMPELNGGDVVERIRAEHPDFPIFVITALARRLSDPRINASSVQGVFAKPTNLGQLAQALEKVGNDA
ncbi:PAS domain-containing hybrid sensor histidine kinase/response regulator [Shimia ponticola]|uniref:PAS domain-containing hybrid sensor histidine kinase/response regulator n=1 Tax=Shimia ponticola TaxID=2582893 RepID=UPI0011BF77F6|nr:PAS domain-containing protein [Shimia ponticola]